MLLYDSAIPPGKPEVHEQTEENTSQLNPKGLLLDPYSTHRSALAPLLRDTTLDCWAPTGKDHLTEFVSFLYSQKLHALWFELLSKQTQLPELKELLGAATRMSVAMKLPQQRLLGDAHEALKRAEIPYFVAKGAHLQRVVYAEAMYRPATDVDLFVHSRDLEAAIDCLIKAGFVAKPLAETLSHELKLTKHNVAIDLHWHLMRPGRYRTGLMDWLYKHREKFGDYWGLDATASLLVMLAHPAITKYLISPTSMLIHQVDQARLIQSGKVVWTELYEALDRYGLKTAAWSSLYLLRQLTDIEAPERLEQQLQPGFLHRAWLRQWIDRAWITRFFEHRWLVSGLFNLALQDSIGDAINAIKKRNQALAQTLPELAKAIAAAPAPGNPDDPHNR